MTMAESKWDDDDNDLFDSLFEEQESLSAKTNRAEGLRKSSDSEEETLSFRSSTASEPGPQLWWVEQLKKHASFVDMEKGLHKCRLLVLSGCTGLCAESHVLKAGRRQRHYVCIAAGEGMGLHGWSNKFALESMEPHI